jgi:molybdopterin molybdotransferase
MISVEEAFDRIVNSAKPLQTERLAIRDAVGRVLAAPLAARKSQPGWALSAMDGYAVISGDLTGSNSELTVVGEVPAGAKQFPAIESGEAYRIFTGGPLPINADQIVIQENVERAHDTIRTDEQAKSGNNIRAAGIDFTERQIICDAGTFITPKIVGLIAGSGHSHVMVHRAPTVSILATGDELASADLDTYSPSDVIDSNTPMLESLFRDAGGAIDKILRIPDDKAATEQAIEQTSSADILITIGGASVGDHDYIKPAMEARSIELDFWKIAMRPGKPLIYGKQGNRHIIGLPGNPISAFVCALMFVRPLIDQLMGRPAPIPNGVNLPCAVDLPENGPRQHYMRARLIGNPGKRMIDPAASQDSSLLSVLAQSDGLLIRKPNAPAISAGDLVPFLPF